MYNNLPWNYDLWRTAYPPEYDEEPEDEEEEDFMEEEEEEA